MGGGRHLSANYRLRKETCPFAAGRRIEGAEGGLLTCAE